ncbi:MAG: GNAT family N-acetyltransferase [Bacteroidetes bacterium]|nr:GNAT family N-acetyltransferase [Bacteroidota bacterium]MBS1756925.1 GNAT family N-acetyltransferase [Bacteroidota bacterium]
MKDEIIIVKEAEAQAVIEELENNLYEHNSNTINRHDGALFALNIKNKSQEMIAGIAGWTWASACEITHLWVSKAERNKGFGKKLLQAAEDIAIKNGCVKIIIKSYSFQAPSFYENYGYKTECIIADFPKGNQYHILTKDIG